MDKSSLFQILITSPPDRNYIVAEIWYNRQLWVEISQEIKEPIIQIYRPAEMDYWKLNYDDVVSHLIKAKNALFEYDENRILENHSTNLNKFRITVVSLPDREHLVAEIIYESVRWVEISQENKELRIQFYPHPNNNFWEFSYDEAIAVLEKAKNKLLAK